MSGYVLDASAVLAFLNAEPGHHRFLEVFETAVISAVNLSEVVAKLAEDAGDFEAKLTTLGDLRLHVVDFDDEAAVLAGRLRRDTKRMGISFGDRACLALAQIRGAVALTTDRRWSDLPTEVADVEQMR